MADPLPLGVLVSGSGTNLQAIIDAIAERRLHAEIRVVVSNIATAPAVARGRAHAISTVVLDHHGFATRESFDARIVEILQDHTVGLVVLAGFNRLLSRVLIRAFPMRIMNIHPALLPAFPGLHAPRQAFEYGVRIAGATVHFVDEQLDHGPIVMQAAVPAFPDDTQEALRQRILAEEHQIYPRAIQLFAEGRLHIDGRRVIVTDTARDQGSLINPAPR